MAKERDSGNNVNCIEFPWIRYCPFLSSIAANTVCYCHEKSTAKHTKIFHLKALQVKGRKQRTNKKTHTNKLKANDWFADSCNQVSSTHVFRYDVNYRQARKFIRKIFLRCFFHSIFLQHAKCRRHLNRVSSLFKWKSTRFFFRSPFSSLRELIRWWHVNCELSVCSAMWCTAKSRGSCFSEHSLPQHLMLTRLLV